MAIAKSNGDAMINLAAFYFNGINRPSDPAAAYALAYVAARLRYAPPNAADTCDRMREQLNSLQLKTAQDLIDRMVHQGPLAVLEARALNMIAP